MKIRHIALLTLALATTTAAVAAPITIGGVEYTRQGNTEVGIVASFGPAPTAVSTSTLLLYSGFVEVVVSGTGAAQGTNLNDAFYVFSPGPVVHNPSFYQLALDSVPITGAPGVPTPAAQLAVGLIVFDVDAGMEVTPIYVPGYRAADHTYNFVVDVSRTDGYAGIPTLLSFGVANGVYSDNSGAFSIDVHQLAAVPEPTTLASLGLGFLGLVAFARRRRG